MNSANNQDLQKLDNEMKPESQELLEVFNILENFIKFQIEPPQKQQFKKVFFNKNFFFENNVFWGYAGIFSTLFLMIFILKITDFLSIKDALFINYLLLFFSLLILGFMAIILIEVFKILRQDWRESKQLPYNILKKSLKTYIRFEKFILQLSSYDKKTLKRAEITIKNLIDEQQERKKKFDSLVPILSLVIVVVIFYFLNINPQELEQKFVYGTISGITGLVGLISLFLKFYSDSSASRIQIYNRRCLSILEQAQQISNETQNLEQVKPSQINSSDISIMEKLKRIQIDGPLNYDHND